MVERELAAFEPALLERLRILVGSKLDAARDERRKELARVAKKRRLPYFEISAATGSGLPEVVAWLASRLEAAA